MTTTSLFNPYSRLFGACSLALGLAWSSAALAVPVTANVSVTGFSVSTTANAYIWAVDSVAYQTWQMTALNAGGLLGSSSNSYSAFDLNPVHRLAQTSTARATGDTTQYTDNSTGLNTYGFDLRARAFPSTYALGTPSNSANATATQSGGFMLIDADGNGVAGDLSFTVFYDLDVSATFGAAPGTYGEAVLNLLASDDGGDNFAASDVMTSYTETGGVGSRSGSFTWTFTLGANDASYYTLGGSAIAFAIPEPGALLLASTGLLAALLGTRRRKAIAAQ